MLTRQWSEAQGELDRINGDVLQMNKLSSDVGNDASLAAYLLDSVRAARSLSGGVDEDFHRLSVLEDDTNSTTVQIDRLLGELSTNIQRQQQYISGARNDLNVLALAIKNGQLYGSSLSSSRNVVPGAIQPTLASTGERPLVVIRFDRPNVSYENALYTAVKGAIDRPPLGDLRSCGRVLDYRHTRLHRDQRNHLAPQCGLRGAVADPNGLDQRPRAALDLVQPHRR